MQYHVGIISSFYSDQAKLLYSNRILWQRILLFGPFKNNFTPNYFFFLTGT